MLIPTTTIIKDTEKWIKANAISGENKEQEEREPQIWATDGSTKPASAKIEENKRLTSAVV